jgi:hypothetical protein
MGPEGAHLPSGRSKLRMEKCLLGRRGHLKALWDERVGRYVAKTRCGGDLHGDQSTTSFSRRGIDDVNSDALQSNGSHGDGWETVKAE